VSTFVIDANVAVKWLLDSKDEPLVDEALRLLERHESGEVQFIVPDLFWAEVGNIFWKASRKGRCSISKAERSILALQSSKLLTFPSQPLLQLAFQIASGWGRTVYDSLYVALAAESRNGFITADEKLVNALAGRFPLQWLGSF
jgi:predicted nucleic acid-binding protein